jgi:hypothetical protein
MKFTTLIVPALLMLTACSEFQYYSSTGFAPVTSKRFGADYWLEEVHKTRTMTPEQRQVALKLWEQEYSNNPDTSNRLRLALLLAAGSESIRNPERALELLEGINPEPENAGDRELIIMLRQFIDEQLKTEATINDLKNLTKKKNRQIKELEQQLQALTNIEQNIQQRENQLETDNDIQ